MTPPVKSIHGWLVVDKPTGIGSTKALGWIRSTLGIRKAGHAGTLDPMASGILPIAIGEATKTVHLTMNADKEYLFSIGWGESTATLDAEGEITARSAVRPDHDQICHALTAFIGETDQRPPNYSAIKVNGKRSYELARAGDAKELPSRRVTLFDAKVIDPQSPDTTTISIRCGKGFYVRALARDLAQKLGAQGHVTALRRTRVGCFSLTDAKTLEMIAQMGDKGNVEECLVPITQALDGIEVIEISGEDSSNLRHGRHIAIETAPTPKVSRFPGNGDHHHRLVALAVEADTPVALGEIRGDRFHPTRVFGITKRPDPAKTR